MINTSTGIKCQHLWKSSENNTKFSEQISGKCVMSYWDFVCILAHINSKSIFSYHAHIFMIYAKEMTRECT